VTNTQRKTKIVCTIGPATSTAAAQRQLVAAGMDVARLNFSHGDHQSHGEAIRSLRRTAAEAGREVGILQDLCGPKIRLGKLPEGGVVLRPGEGVALAPDGSGAAGALPVSYPHLLEDVHEGDRILLADGLVELKVRARRPDRLECEVQVGGTLGSGKGVNLPGAALRVASFTAKDRSDLAMGLAAGVDFVALSFVRHEDDLDPVSAMLEEATDRPLLIAKIEKPEALERLHRILERVDGVMVARGDLGVEMPVEEVPLIQKRVITEARRAGRPVITATQMLRSMVESPRPLRAEATDVANAILDGSDALMLSEETAVGSYPVAAVEMLDRIARVVEPTLDPRARLDEPVSDLVPGTAGAISRAACALAEDVNAVAIFATTKSGGTARLVARLRPRRPVVGLTSRAIVRRQLTLSWGVVPAAVELFTDTDSAFERAVAWAREQGLARPGDRIVVTAGLPVNVPGGTDLVRVIEV